MAHTNDVIFTEQGLAEFIQQIRQNPEMVCQVRAATNEEIDRHNETHPTLAEGRIPGKGITIIQANGDKFSVAVGSDVKSLPEVQGKYNVGDPGTITFIVDEAKITIPVDGITKVLSSVTEDNLIPNANAVTNYIENMNSVLKNQILKILSGDSSGYIPGAYTVKEITFSEAEISNIETKLKNINVTDIPGAMVNGTIINSSGIIQNDKIITFLEDKKATECTPIISHYENLYDELGELNLYMEEINAAQLEAEEIKDVAFAEFATQQEKTFELCSSIISDISNFYSAYQIQGDGTYNFLNLNNELNSLFIDPEGLRNAQLQVLQSNFVELQEAFSTLQNYAGTNYPYADRLGYGVIKDTQKNNNQLTQDFIDIGTVIINAVKAIVEDNAKVIDQASDEEKIIINEIQSIYTSSNTALSNLKDNVKQIIIKEQERKNKLDDYNIKNNNYLEIQNEYNQLVEESNELSRTIKDYEQTYETAVELSQNILAIQELLRSKGGKTWDVRETQDSSVQASLSAYKIYGAVFNDYAEYRNTVTANPGHVVIENGDGSLSLATKRLQLGANIISDTYGFAIGKTDSAQTPIAVCGRVLAYPYEELMLFTPGAAVCSGPNGTVSIMTREEIREWPDAIIGYVSEIPSYEYWGTDNIKVDGRLWIKLA